METVGTLLSGLIVMGVALMKGLGVKYRLLALLGGAGTTVYALWGITRTSGTFYYSARVIAIPVLLAGALVVRYFLVKRSGTSASQSPPPLPPSVPVESSAEPAWPASDAPSWQPAAADDGAAPVGYPAFAPAFVDDGPALTADPTPPASLGGWSRPATESLSEMTVMRSDLPQPMAVPAQPSAPAADAKFCPRCGFALRSALPSCPRCGAPLR